MNMGREDEKAEGIRKKMEIPIYPPCGLPSDRYWRREN